MTGWLGGGAGGSVRSNNALTCAHDLTDDRRRPPVWLPGNADGENRNARKSLIGKAAGEGREPMSPRRSILRLLLTLAMALSFPIVAQAQGRVLETLDIPADQNRKWATRTVLKAGVTYTLEARGIFDAWGTEPPGIDAVWCFKLPRCATPEVWQQLRVDGVGLADLARATQGSEHELPYSEQHVYLVPVQGQDRPLELWLWDAVENRSAGDNRGAITVTLYGPGRRETKTRQGGPTVVLATPTTRPLGTEAPAGRPVTAAPATGSASEALTVRWLGMERDIVGAGSEPTPNGQPDGQFRLELDGGDAVRTVDYIALYTADASGAAAGGQVWDTRPNAYWILGVERSGYRLNPRDGDIADQIWGKVSYDVFADDTGWFKPGQNFLLLVHFMDGARITANAAIPEEPPAAGSDSGSGTRVAGADRAGPPAAVGAIFVGLDRDAVGPARRTAPDGVADGRFRVSVDTGGIERTLNRIRIDSLGGGQAWDTEPGIDRFLAVERGDLRLNTGDGGIAERLRGRAAYDVFASDAGLFRMGQEFRVTVRFADGGEATTEIRVGEGATGGVTATMPARPLATPSAPPLPAAMPGATAAPPAVSYRSRWDRIGGEWSTGWLAGNAEQACSHSSNCSCHGQNFCGDHPNGTVTFVWPEGCERPAWMIRCLSEPER